MTKEQAIKKVIDIAKGELGYLEKRSNYNLDDKTANAGQNNYTKYWRDIKISYQKQPWCACYITWILVQAFGVEIATKLLKHYPFVYCPTLGSLFKLNSNPKVGDIVLFYRNGTFAHTGIVIGVNGDYFSTIEGNTSGASTIIANGGGVCQKGYYNSNLPGTKFVTLDWSIVADLPSGDEVIIKEYENIEEILWELGHRNIVSDEEVWRSYMTNDTNVYWLCRKIIQQVRTKDYTEYADRPYTDIEEILWELGHRGIVTNTDLWREKMTTDSNIYWLCQKAVHYIRTQKKEI